jgi:hypothetical protein
MAAAVTLALVMTVQSVVLSAAKGRPEGPPLRLEHRVAPARLQVRVYDAGVMPAAEQTVALRAAAGVLAAAGIDVTWLSCGNDAAAAHAASCDTPPGHGVLSVRFVRLPGTPSARGELRLGYSLVDTGIGEGSLATMYVDRVQWLAAQARADAAVLLGFAVAHEIGHLLLGTNAHAGAGLMRAVWSRAQLQHAGIGDWRFSADEAVKMRSSLEKRNGLRSSRRDATGCPAARGDHPDASDASGDCGATAVASLRAVAPRAHR